MGYSCTQDASHMLGVISRMCGKDGNGNILRIDGKEFFFERGKEQGDGAITGTLMEMLPGDFCRKAGSVRINPDGTIARFPRFTKRDKEEAENTLRDMQARNPQLLNNWSMGRI